MAKVRVTFAFFYAKKHRFLTKSLTIFDTITIQLVVERRIVNIDYQVMYTLDNDLYTKSSRRKTKVGFPPTFAFRPLTPPYMRVRIRRFLICNGTFRSIPSVTGSLLVRGFYCSLRLALYHYAPLPSSPYSHYPIDTHAIVVSRI